MSSVALRAGNKMGDTEPLLFKGTFFSARRKESVAAAVSTPVSANKYTLWSSGFTDEVAAQPTTLRSSRIKSADFIVNDFSADTRGSVGNSSFGIVFIDALEVPASILST